jgi:hypothetical protein
MAQSTYYIDGFRCQQKMLKQFLHNSVGLGGRFWTLRSQIWLHARV